MVREISYQTYLSGWMDSKRKPVSKERYFPIDTINKGVDEGMKEALRKAREDKKRILG